MRGGTVIIDDAANGGSHPGAWATHIAHTPALRAQCVADDFEEAARGLSALPARGEAGEARRGTPPAALRVSLARNEVPGFHTPTAARASAGEREASTDA